MCPFVELFLNNDLRPFKIQGHNALSKVEILLKFIFYKYDIGCVMFTNI